MTPHRFGVRVLTVVVASTLTAGLLGISAPTAVAQASGPTLPGFGDTVGSGGSTAKPRPKPRPRPKGGDQGTPTRPRPAPGPRQPVASDPDVSRIPLRGGPTMTPPVVPGFAGPPACPTRADGEASSGWTYTGVVETRKDGGLLAGLPRTVSISYSCYYRPYSDVRARCGWSVAGQVTGPQGNPRVPSRTTVYPRTLTDFAKGDTTQAACTASFKVDYASPLTDWGYYTLGTQGEQASCRWRKYGDGAREVRFLGCSAPYTLPPRTFRATLWCGGFRLGEHVPGLAFTINDCQGAGGQPAAWSCIGGTDATFDGIPAIGPRGARPSVLADAKPRRAAWTPVGVTGAVSNIREQQRRIVPSRKGTPYRAGVGAAHDTQHFTANPAAANPARESGWSSGWGNDWRLAFFLAGFPDKPSVWSPEWRFTGDFTVRTTAITAMDPVSGQVATTTTTTTVTDKGICKGTPLAIDVFRARSTSQ